MNELREVSMLFEMQQVEEREEFGSFWDWICEVVGDIWDWIASHACFSQSKGGQGQPEGQIGICV